MDPNRPSPSTGTAPPSGSRPARHAEQHSRRSPRFTLVADAYYLSGRRGTPVPEHLAADRLTAAELVVAGAYEEAGAEERGIAVAVPDLPPTRLERALELAWVEAARRHRWQTARTWVWLAMLIALATNAAMMLVG